MSEFTQWEYHVQPLRVTDKWSAKKQEAELVAFTSQLNALGAQGWELVEYQAIPLTGSFNASSINGYMHMALFKRRKTSAVDVTPADFDDDAEPAPPPPPPPSA